MFSNFFQSFLSGKYSSYDKVPLIQRSDDFEVLLKVIGKEERSHPELARLAAELRKSGYDSWSEPFKKASEAAFDRFKTPVKYESFFRGRTKVFRVQASGIW